MSDSADDTAGACLPCQARKITIRRHSTIRHLSHQSFYSFAKSLWSTHFSPLVALTSGDHGTSDVRSILNEVRVLVFEVLR